MAAKWTPVQKGKPLVSQMFPHETTTTKDNMITTSTIVKPLPRSFPHAVHSEVLNLVLWTAFLWLGFACPIHCQGQPASLSDEITGDAIGAGTTRAIVLIHGWNPSNVSDGYQASAQWSYLLNILRLKLTGSDWKLVAYHWERGPEGANTGPVTVDASDFLGYGNATVAALHAQQQGAALSTLLSSQAPELRRVHIIAHSAGSWAAREAIRLLLQGNPYIVCQLTLLDPFIPDASTLVGTSTGLSTPLMSATAGLPGNERIHRLENYFADDLVSQGTVFGTISTQESFVWRSGDTNLQVDWGATLTPGLHLYYDYHSGPIEFYADTVKADIIGETIEPGLYGIECPWSDFTVIGWYRSLYQEEFLLPKITVQPQDQTIQAGGTATFTVNAIRASSFQWTKNGIVYGTDSTLAVLAISGNEGDYVVRVSNASGLTFSRKARLTIIPAATAPVIVTPPQNQTVTENQTATFSVVASGTPSPNYQWQRNTTDIPGATSSTYTTPPLVRANNGDQFRVHVSNSAGSTMSGAAILTVNNAPLPSNADPFEPNDSSLTATPLPLNSSVNALIGSPADVDWFQFPVSQEGTLNLSLSVPPANDYDLELYGPSGTFVQGSYRDTGQTENILYTVTTLGTYYVRVYGFPLGSGSFNAAAPYTLTCTFNAAGNPPPTYTLNISASNGSVTRSPDLANYSSGSVVTLTATPNPGYQFGGWSGDASGTSNPLTVTMNANKNIAANFAPLPAGAGSIRVSIVPQAAADAGAQWKLTTEADWHNSGNIVPVASLTTYDIQFKTIPGWTTPANKTVTLFPAQTDIWIDSDPYVQQPVLPLYEYFSGIAYGNNIFVVVGGATTVVTTPDGVNWARQTGLTDLYPSAITYGNNLFAVAGNYNNAGRIMTSPNGTNWTSRFTSSSVNLRSIAFGQGTYIAVGETGRPVTSPDGVNWTLRDAITSYRLYGITYANGQFVTVGDRAVILTSSDGLNWTQRSLNTGASLSGVGFGNNIIAAVGWDGDMITSGNAVTWNTVLSPAHETLSLLTGVAFGNNSFGAVGNNDTFATSSDGVNWTARHAGTGKTLRGVAYGNSIFVAAGWQGALVPIATSYQSLISVQPLSHTRTTGEDVTFSVGAGGAAPITYQWRFEGADIPGETNASLTLYTLTTNRDGNYWVVVQNPAGLQVSQAATLTVNPAPVPPLLSASCLPSNGGVQLNISCESSRNYRIQATTNLTTWIDLSSFYSTNATAVFQDDGATNYSQRFYRVVTP